MTDLVTLEAIELPDVAGDIVDLTPGEAEQITGRIRKWVNEFPAEDVVRAYRGRIWIALAYDSWAEWCECELGGLKLPVPQRREVVTELAHEGMSQRSIAEVVGASVGTVNADLSGVQNRTPAEVTGQDGKTYPRPEPKPVEPDEVIDAEVVDEPSSPRRRPLVDQARDAGWDLRKSVERVERLTADDRFNAQIEKMAPHLRGHLTNAIEVCQDLLDRLNTNEVIR